MTDVEHDVDVLFVFEVSVKTDNKLVCKRPVDLNFAGQLLPGLCSGEVGFRHYFESPGLVLIFFSLDGLESTDFVALCESSFAQKALSQIFDNFALFGRVIWVDRLAFLLYDLSSVSKI